MDMQDKGECHPPTIALFGLFGCNNLGNEATLAAVVHALKKRQPKARLALVSEPPPPQSGLPSIPARFPHDPLPVETLVKRVSPWRFQKLARPVITLASEPLRSGRTRRQARQIDQFVVAGTGIADDYYQGPLDVPIDLQRWCTAIKDTGGKVQFLSVGAGPVSHWLSLRWFRKALQIADYRSYRENSSRAFAVQIGVNANQDPVLPDMVFGLPVKQYLARRQPQWPPQVIGLGVMAYRGWNVDTHTGEAIYASYMERLTRLAKALIEKGYPLRLLIGARNSDPRAVQALLDNLTPDERARVTAADIQSYKDVLSEITETDLVIATRFHNVLKALLLERLAISIEYGHKNSDLMAEMGLQKYCHTIENFDPDAVLEQVQQLATLPAPPVEQVRARVGEYRKQVRMQFDQITAQHQTDHREIA